jgi:cytochrome c oxidase cbb3-type subunit I/II
MYDPSVLSPGSIMPAYPWLFENQVDFEDTPKKIRAMQTLGVPYPEGYDKVAVEDARRQGREIVAELKKSGVEEVAPLGEDDEIVAVIAYLQRIGTDIKAKPKAEAKK